MDKKIILLFMFVFLFSLSFTIAEDSLPERQPAKLDTAYIISQPCATCTYVNISIYSKGEKVVDNQAMTLNGVSWEYNFTPTTSARHDVNGNGDINGNDDSFAFFFQVTDNGLEKPEGNVIIVFLIAFIIIVMFGMYSTLKLLGVAVELEADIIDVAINVGTYLAVFALYVLSTQYLGNAMIENILLITIKYAWITHVFAPFVAFLVSMIFNPLRLDRNNG